MKPKVVQSYAELFDAIDHHCATGSMSEGRAEVERLQLTAEIHELTRPAWQKILIVLFWIGFILFLIGIAAQIFLIATGLVPGWLPKT